MLSKVVPSGLTDKGFLSYAVGKYRIFTLPSVASTNICKCFLVDLSGRQKEGKISAFFCAKESNTKTLVLAQLKAQLKGQLRSVDFGI